MEACSFPEENHVLGPPKGLTEEQVHSLNVHVTTQPQPLCISCWKLTKDELELINKTGKVWLWVSGLTMPPVILTVASPFQPPPEQGDERIET
jgi:hypothetical protein